MPYLDYLEALLPQQRREAIFRLADRAFGANPGGLDGHPRFMSHPKLAPELARLEIRHLGIADLYHVVGPVEFVGGGATAPIMYPLYGGGNESSFGYYVQVHILAGIGNKSGG